MMRSKTKSKQIRPQSAKLDLVLGKRTQTLKVNQKLQQSPLRPSSQDYHTSLNHNLLHKNYLIMRKNLSSQKKNNRAKASLQTNSNEFLLNNLQVEDEVIRKSKSKHNYKQTKSRKENNQRKQTIHLGKQKQEKQTLQVRVSNKQKSQPQQKDSKQHKQSKTKMVPFKAFIGSKLRKKLQSYLLFVNLINYSIRIKYKAPEVRKYTVYVGKGNNSKLVKKLFSNRFWWNVTSKAQNGKNVNLVWSQWSKPNIFSAIPKSVKSQKALQPQDTEQNNLNEDNKTPPLKHKSSKSKQTFLKKLSNESIPQLQQLYDLLQQNDRKILLKKLQKKQLRQQTIKQLISKQSTKSFKKLSIQLTHNHIENHQQFTNKKHLFLNLKQFYKDQIFDIVPLTYHVCSMDEQSREEGSLAYVMDKVSQFVGKKDEKKDSSKDSRASTLWIVKPGENSNRGCGIQVFKKVQQIKAHIQKEKLKHPQRTFIVQKYLNPFLYHRRKFDIRCYLLVTCTPHIRAYYYPVGYIRTSSCQFSTKNCSNRFIHLTNDAIQKKQQEYGKYQKGNKVTYEQFQKYLDFFQSKKQLNFFKQILPKMQQAMLKTVKVMASRDNNNKRKLNPQSRVHSFQLYGYDFMIDDNFVPWLIEINTNPCIQTGCEILQDIIPGLLENVLKICVDTVFPPPKFEDWPLNQILTCPEQIFQQNQFQLIYSQLEE